MKKILIGLMVFVGLLSFTLINKSDNNDKALGRVQKVEGKFIFLGAEPVNEYEVLFDIKAKGYYEPTVSGISSFALKKARKQVTKHGYSWSDIDAVIIGSSKYDQAIKFK